MNICNSCSQKCLWGIMGKPLQTCIESPPTFQTKICVRCGITKSITEFYERSNKCKQCHIEYQKKYRRENKEPREKWWSRYIRKRLANGRQYKLGLHYVFEMPTGTHQKCTKCRKWKPLERFQKDNRPRCRKGYRRTTCRNCENARKDNQKKGKITIEKTWNTSTQNPHYWTNEKAMESALKKYLTNNGFSISYITDICDIIAHKENILYLYELKVGRDWSHNAMAVGQILDDVHRFQQNTLEKTIKAYVVMDTPRYLKRMKGLLSFFKLPIGIIIFEKGFNPIPHPPSTKKNNTKSHVADRF